MTEKGHARFLVKATEQIRDIKRLAILGEVLDGRVTAGMKTLIRLNSQLSVEVTVSGIEVLNTAEGCKIALSIQCESVEELEMLVALNVGEGEVLELRDA